MRQERNLTLVLILTLFELRVLVVLAVYVPDSSNPPPPRRDVVALSQWAKDQDIVMHEHLQWKKYTTSDDGDAHEEQDDGDWGLELKAPVPPGTTLLSVPRNLVLDAKVLAREFKEELDGEISLDDLLGEEFADRHTDNFWIVFKLYLLRRHQCSGGSGDDDDDAANGEDKNRWSAWVRALPQEFPEFSKAEQECLPFYARYAAEYQDKKLQAFIEAAKEVLKAFQKETGDAESIWNKDDFKWAFLAAGSRLWKTAPLKGTSEAPSTELVPIGDMFNHREPPNVAITHDNGSVNFVYTGNDDGCGDSDGKDLYITYGQPSNTHRFVVIFGFCPNDVADMPFVWSQLAYGAENPFSTEVDKMVFGTADGSVSQQVWDAILYELLQPSSQQVNEVSALAAKREAFEKTKELKHAKYKKYTYSVLETHIDNQLQELAMLRQKLEQLEKAEKVAHKKDNIALIRQHNDFLTSVFSKVKARLAED